MPSQRRVVASGRSVSPAGGEAGAARRRERVSVEVENGERGFLDMKRTRGAHWARRIDKPRTTRRPVLVEIAFVVRDGGDSSNMRADKVPRVSTRFVGY